jgi:OOP family OmpA-OmpF porin
MRKLLVVGCIVCTAATTFAQDSERFYVGGSVGSVKANTGVSGLTGTASLDERDTGYKLYAGYAMNQYASVELQYANFGEATLSGTTGDHFSYDGQTYQFLASNASLRLKTDSIGASVLLGMPLGEQVTPFVRAGLHRWESDMKITATNISTNDSDHGTDPFFGVGLDVKIIKNISARIEAERYKIDSDNGDFISAGIKVAF